MTNADFVVPDSNEVACAARVNLYVRGKNIFKLLTMFPVFSNCFFLGMAFDSMQYLPNDGE
jgi:hypothetical protein